MKRSICLFVYLFVCLFGSANAAGSASATVILIENFNTDGLGTRYTAAGAGGSSLGCCQNWSLNSQDEGNRSDVLTGFEGLDFWSGSDLNDPSLPSGFSNSTPRNLVLNAVNLGLFTNETLSIALSASSNLDVGNDFLRILAIDSDTNARIVLDMFDGSTAGSISGTVLGTTFQDVYYDLSGLNFSNLSIGFEAWTTTNEEVIGIDNIRLTGYQISPIPEPSSIALMLGGLGLVGFMAARRRKQV